MKDKSRCSSRRHRLFVLQAVCLQRESRAMLRPSQLPVDSSAYFNELCDKLGQELKNLQQEFHGRSVKDQKRKYLHLLDVFGGRGGNPAASVFAGAYEFGSGEKVGKSIPLSQAIPGNKIRHSSVDNGELFLPIQTGTIIRKPA